MTFPGAWLKSSEIEIYVIFIFHFYFLIACWMTYNDSLVTDILKTAKNERYCQQNLSDNDKI